MRAVATDKMAHAYLFEGPPGVGKALTARAAAMALNCELRGNDACCECVSCKKIIRKTHPDVRWLTLPEGKRRIPIESVREADSWLKIIPHEGRAKVLIIDPADQMSEPAANALLKTLEEPRQGSFLFLLTAVASSLLPTVRSRCQKLRFASLNDSTVVDLLVEQGIENADAEVIASLSEGSMERAASYSEEEIVARLTAVGAILDGAASRLPGKALNVAATLRGDRSECIAVLELLMIVLDELLWLRSLAGEVSDADISPLARRLDGRLERFATTGTPFGTARHIAAVHKAVSRIKRNNMNPQLAIEGMLIAMRGRLQEEDSWGRIGAR